jgi:hypothetical protein
VHHLPPNKNREQLAMQQYTISIKFNLTRMRLQISDVVPYGPAHYSRRVLPGDVVVAVDGIKATLLSIKELCGACRGPHGTECRLRLSRKAGYDGAGKKCGTEFDVLLERGPNRHDEQIPRTTYRQVRNRITVWFANCMSHSIRESRLMADEVSGVCCCIDQWRLLLFVADEISGR